MLRHGSMRAGDFGESLATAYNDLFVVSCCPEVVSSDPPKNGPFSSGLPNPDAPLSPMPWQIRVGERCARLVDARGTGIAHIAWRGALPDRLAASLVVVASGLACLKYDDGCIHT